mgnify:FL=1
MSRLPSVGITESLAVPGIVPLPPATDASANIALQLASARGVAGNLAPDIGVQQRRRASERARAEREAEVFLRGQASLDYAVGISGYRDRITDPDPKNRLMVPVGLTPADFARQLIENDTKDMPAAYKDQYTKHAAPALTELFIAQRRAIQTEARKDNLSMLTGAASTAPSSTAVMQIRAAAQRSYPDLTDREWGGVLAHSLSASAASGNRTQFDIISGAMPQGFQDEIVRQRATLEDNEIQAEERRVNLGRQRIDQLRLQNEPAAVILDAIDKSELLDSSAKELERRQTLNSVQKQGADSILSKITLGNWIGGTPAATEAEIRRRMTLPPDSPDYVDGTDGSQLLNHLGNTIKFDADRVVVSGAFNAARAGTTPIPLPAGQGYDNPMLSLMADEGVVSGFAGGGGKFALTSIDRPVAFAARSVAVNLVPEQAKDMIRAGMTSPNADQALDALATYAAIGLQNRALAEDIPLPKDAALKGRFVLNALSEVPPADLRDEAKLRELVRPLAATAVKMDPTVAAMDNDQVLGTVLFSDPNAKMVNSLTYQRDKTTEQSNKLSSSIRVQFGDAPKIVPGNVANTFERHLIDEYKIQRSLIPDDVQASREAVAAATRLTLREHPINLWGGTPRYGRSGDVFTDPAALRREAETQVGAETASLLWNHYTPEFAATKSGRPAWVFRDIQQGSHALYESSNGGLVISLPIQGTIQKPPPKPTLPEGAAKGLYHY